MPRRPDNEVSEPENNGVSGKVIAFRLKEPALSALKSRFDTRPIVGITSVEKFVRKLAMDYASGKLVYLNPRDAANNPALRS